MSLVVWLVKSVCGTSGGLRDLCESRKRIKVVWLALRYTIMPQSMLRMALPNLDSVSTNGHTAGHRSKSSKSGIRLVKNRSASSAMALGTPHPRMCQ